MGDRPFLLCFLVNLVVRPVWVGVLYVGPVYLWSALLEEWRDRGMLTEPVSVFL